MKRLLLSCALLFCSTIICLAIVGPGAPQRVTVSRDAEGVLQFVLDDGKIFTEVDIIAKHSLRRSGSVTEKSKWSNSVEITISVPLSDADIQYIGDRFVAEKVYPLHYFITHTGKTETRPYRPVFENLKKKRKLT